MQLHDTRLVRPNALRKIQAGARGYLGRDKARRIRAAAAAPAAAAAAPSLVPDPDEGELARILEAALAEFV